MTKQKLLSYHGDPKIKQKVVSRMKAHIAADELKQGETGNNGKGCLVWCAIDIYDHELFSEKLGVDLWIPKFLDRVFEGMTPNKAQQFSLRFFETLPEGKTKKDTDLIRLKILHYILTEILPKKYQKQKNTAKIISMFEQAITGVTITSEQWRAATTAATAATTTAATTAAYAAAYATAAYADADAAYATAAYAAAAADADAAYADADAADAAYATATAAITDADAAYATAAYATATAAITAADAAYADAAYAAAADAYAAYAAYAADAYAAYAARVDIKQLQKRRFTRMLLELKQKQ